MSSSSTHTKNSNKQKDVVDILTEKIMVNDKTSPITLKKNSPKEERKPISTHLHPNHIPGSTPPKLIQEELIRKEKVAEKKQGIDNRAELFRKIHEYFNSVHLKGWIPEGMKPPPDSASFEQLSQMYRSIQSSFKSKAKRQFVDYSLQTVLFSGENLLVSMMKMEEKQNVGKWIYSQKEELLQPELEEIAIELSDDYIPGPHLRLAGKLMALVNQFSNQTGEEAQEENFTRSFQ